MTPAEAALERLCDPAYEVSAHYVIGQNGTLWQLVDEADRAWHAGAGAWQGRADVNSRSIGVELVNDGSSDFEDRQIATLEALLRGVMGRWDIGPKGVIGHSDMAPGRKHDPGRRFPWDRLAGRGLAIGPSSLPLEAGCAPNPDTFTSTAAQSGYPDATFDELLEAIRSRFAPDLHGPLTQRDMGVVAELAKFLGVDRDGGSA